MKKASTPSRVNYFDKQFLRKQEFADEQGYQIALRRRHNISHHSWGIVVGLEVAAEEEQLVVRPGLAIDGYGRELFLPARVNIDPDEFTRLGSDRLDVWLFYEQTNILNPPAGYTACGSDETDNFLRTRETPRVFLERARVSRVKGREPRLVPKVILESTSQLQTPDDPLAVWPIYLARVTYFREQKDPLKQFLIDASDRPYAGIAAEVIDHPGSATRVEVGKQPKSNETRTISGVTVTYAPNEKRAFAVFVPGESQEPTLEPRFEIDVDDNNCLRGTTNLYGNLVMAKGAVQFTEPKFVDDEATRKDAAIYRALTFRKTGAGATTSVQDDELRIDLGQLSSNERVFVIGHTTEDGAFRPAMRLEFTTPPAGVEPQPLLTIYGDLKLEGLIQSAGTKERTLPEETLQALLASFQAGISGAQSR